MRVGPSPTAFIAPVILRVDAIGPCIGHPLRTPGP